MAFCMNCGHALEEEAKFCPNCGEPIEKTADGEAEGKTDHSQSEVHTETDPVKKDIEDHKLMGILAYFSILVLIPILAAPDSRFSRFHANQGLILLIGEAAWSVIQGVLSTVFTLLGLPVLATVLALFDLVFLVFTVIGIVNVCNGEEKELPIIGHYRILK